MNTTMNPESTSNIDDRGVPSVTETRISNATKNKTLLLIALGTILIFSFVVYLGYLFNKLDE